MRGGRFIENAVVNVVIEEERRRDENEERRKYQQESKMLVDEEDFKSITVEVTLITFKEDAQNFSVQEQLIKKLKANKKEKLKS